MTTETTSSSFRLPGRFYNVVLLAVVLSTAAAVWGFQRALTENTTQLVTAFRADNQKALAAGDLPVITSRLNALMSSSNWVCVSASQDGQPFFEQKRGNCGSSFLQRQYPLSSPSNSDVKITLTLRLPQPLERSFVMQVLLNILCLGLIFWGTRKAEQARRREELARAELLARLASQVAHDIRSPLAVLESAAGTVSGIQEDQRLVIRRASTHLREIANGLLSRYATCQLPVREAPMRAASPASAVALTCLVQGVVGDKRVQYRERPNIRLESGLDEEAYGLFAKANATELRRVLSNLIDNAVEALPETGGRVDVDLTSRDGQALLVVRDTGRGIPRDLLDKVGTHGYTHGKSGGSGLGLAHAKAFAAAWGGRLHLASIEGEGTAATLALPLTPAPSWFVSVIALDAIQTVVVLDDDKSIHEVWRQRLSTFDCPRLKLVHTYSPQELRQWVRVHGQAARGARFLLDHQLAGHPETGLDLAEELGLAARSVLVTSAHEDPQVVDRCERLGVGLLPKSLASLVPLQPEVGTGEPAVYDAVLIDDEPLVRGLWMRAARANGKRFRAFGGCSEFLAAAVRIDKCTPIYIDHDLGDTSRGELVARDIRRLGFQTIFLATGQSPELFADMPWITKVVGKSAPWASIGEECVA